MLSSVLAAAGAMVIVALVAAMIWLASVYHDRHSRDWFND